MTFRDTDPMFPASWSDTNPRYPLALEASGSRRIERRACHTLRGLGSAATQEHQRFQAQVAVLPLDGRLQSLSGIAHEIEHLGLFVHSRSTLPVGTLVRLRLSSELGEASFTGKIVQSVDRYGIGCAFVDLDECDKAILSLIVAAANSAPEDARTIPALTREITLH